MTKQPFSFLVLLLYAACVLQPILAFGFLIFVLAMAGAAGGGGEGATTYLILGGYFLLNAGIFYFLLGRLRALRPGAGRQLPKLALGSPLSAAALAYLITAATLETQLRDKAELRNCGNNTTTPLCTWFPCLESIHQASDAALRRMHVERKGGKLLRKRRKHLAFDKLAGTEVTDPVAGSTLCLATAQSIRFRDITDEQFRKLVGPGSHFWDKYMLIYRPGK